MGTNLLEYFRILREPQVTEITGDSRSTLWAKAKEGFFTPPVHIGPRSVGWPLREVLAINSARIAGKTNDEIRTLVKDLISERAQSYEFVSEGTSQGGGLAA